MNDIKGTIFFLASTMNQLVDLAEQNDLYPREELDKLKEEEQLLLKELRTNGTTKEVWERVSSIKGVLSNGSSKIADDLWDILAKIELFIVEYYPD